MINKAEEIRKNVSRKIEETQNQAPEKSAPKEVETHREQPADTTRVDEIKNPDKEKVQETEKNKSADLTPTEIGELKKEEQEKEEDQEYDFLHLQDPTQVGNKKKEDENDANAKTPKKIAHGDREAPDEDGFDTDKNAIFQEGDIIQYMFKEWLLKGADWCVNGIINYGIIPVTYESGRAIVNWVSEGVDYVKEEKSAEKNKTNAFAQKVRQELQDFSATSNQIINDPQIDTFINDLGTEIREGRTETIKNILPDFYNAFRELPPELLRERMSPENLQNLTNNIRVMCAARAQFTAHMAAARMLHEKLANVNKFKEKDDEPDQTPNHFQEYRLQARKDFDALINKAVLEGRRPDEVAKQALELSKQAYKQEEKNIKDGKYVENHNSQPGPNAALEKAEAMIKPAKANTEAKTIAEAGHENSSASRELVGIIEEGKLLELRKQFNQERRNALNRSKEKIAGNDNSKGQTGDRAGNNQRRTRKESNTHD